MTYGIPAPLLLTFLATLLFPMLVAPSNAVNAAVAIGWPIPDDARPGQVLFVYDGDTIDVRLDGERVRLRYIGVDAPELFDSDEAHLGREAWAANKGLVLGRQVYIQLDEAERDVYGRLLAYVFTEPAIFVNAWLVEQGYAKAMTIPPNVRYATLFNELEEEARAKRRGIWSHINSKEDAS